MAVAARLNKALRPNITAVYNMARNKKRKGAKKRQAQNRTPLGQHKRDGSRLLPPLATLRNLRLASWVHERLPEVLWCALLSTHAGRDRALDVFRRVAKWGGENQQRITKGADIGLTALASMPEELSTEVLGIICADESDRSVLSPLALLDSLPGRERWLSALQGAVTTDGWNTLRLAVAHVFDHQSQLATDCRWARMIFRITSGQLFFSPEQRELVEELFGYPHVGDQRKVRPTIRSMEISFSRGEDEPVLPWPEAFWTEAFRKTPCLPAGSTAVTLATTAGTTRERLASVSAALIAHERATRRTTVMDARTEVAFGLAAYSLALVRELLAIGNATSILGRIGLRSLLEAHVTLAYLAKRDTDTLWLKFRQYGVGQAKLALLKLDEESAHEAGFAAAELLELIANEDQSAEFVPIELGQWDATHLRQMAIDAGVKDVYDAIYPWTSAFAHSNWGALRNVSFDVCLNALHRAHRLLRQDAPTLDDVLPDAVALADRTLSLVDQLIPSFGPRLE